jgi:hypothetical protein
MTRAPAILAAFATAAAMLAAVYAWGHGSAEWIQRGRYVDQANVHCCGEYDCAVAQPGEMKAIPGGWLHVPTGTSIPTDKPGVYPSIDAQLWRCVRGGELKCVFPAAGV